MKKLFFFKSSTSSSGNNNPVPPPPTCTQAYWENPSDTGVNGQAKVKNSFRSPRGSSKTRKDVFEAQTSDSGPCLRRSLSFSSAALHEGGLGQKNASYYGNQGGSPHTSSNSRKRSDSSQRRSLTPERQPKSKYYEVVDVQNANTHCDSSECSSHCSSNVSNKVLDRYIDGEQEQERSAPESHPPQANHMGNGNCGGKRPPRAQYTAPDSPTYSLKGKPRSHSFRDFSGTQLHFSSRDWAEHGFGHESPRRLAKHVVERLSQSRGFPKTSLKEFDPDMPITIEDIYGGSLKKCTSSNVDGVSQKSFSMDGPGETTNKYQQKEISTSQESNCFPQNNYGRPSSVKAEEEMDVELLIKSKKAEERFLLLSEELEQEYFLEDSGFSMTSLIQTVRDLGEERVKLAREVSSVLQAQIADRASAREEVSMVRAESDSRTRRLEKEKSELQSALEKELDRRSNDWSFKLEKYQAEEHRLRERVRELAEQNVSLQRDVSSLSEREAENRSRITSSEQQFNDLSARIEETTSENQHLRETLSDLQHKYRAAEEDRGCSKRNYEEKDQECKDMHRSITRLQRTCSEQEKTIDGLRKGLSEEVGRKGSLEKYDKQLLKLQMEQIRLTGVEQALRKEIESHRQEVDSLRHENISLLQRLQVSGKEGGFSTFKLDQELLHRVCCLQNQGLSLLQESTQLCAMLVEYIKSKAGQSLETKHDTVAISNGLSEHFIVESGMKVQGFKRGIESLTRNLQTISTVLNEKSNLIVEESQSHCSGGDGLDQLQRSKELIKSKLKAEVLLTSLLREKLYSKELELEQLQAELAAAVRGNDTLKCEVQNALDNFSCMTHKMKDLELQMMKKDEEANRLEDDLQDCRKELGMVRGILPQVSDERDLMWQEVKQYSERNMLLNSEVNALRKKIEALDEDVLLKEGQISILKDSLGKPFDLLASPELV